MIEKDGVELARYGAGKKAVHESLKYIRDHERITPWAKRSGFALLALSIIIVLCKESPQPPSSHDTNQIPTPAFDGNQPSIDLGAYNRGEDVRRFGASGRRPTGSTIKFSGPKLISRSIKIRVPPGTEAKAILITGATNGLVKVKLKEDVTVAGETFLNAGSTLIGQGTSSDERLFVHFTKAVADDGTVSSVEGEIADAKDKTIGLKGTFWSRRGSRLVAGVGLNFIAGASEVLQDRRGEQGASIAKPTLRNAILNGTARSAIEESNEIASKYKNAPPAIEVRAGAEVAIIFTDNGG